MALAIAACGSSTSTSTGGSAGASSAAASTRSTATVTTTATTTPTGTSTSSTGPTATSASASRPPPCVAADLAVSFLGAQGATGHGLLGFAMHNTSRRRCRTFGYPGILFLDRAGHALATATTRTTHDFFGTAPERRLVLAPGDAASFRVGVTHVPTGNQTCTTAAALQVIAPDDTATVRVRIPQGAYECGTATVSPLQPGTSAYSGG